MVAIDIPPAELRQFCRRHHIRRLALFGSVLGPAFRTDSDVDVLVQFSPGRTPGLAFIDMQDELSGLLGGRAVDLVTEKFLNPRIRPSVLQSAVVVYEE
jgi:uncharacterized protein